MAELFRLSFFFFFYPTVRVNQQKLFLQLLPVFSRCQFSVYLAAGDWATGPAHAEYMHSTTKPQPQSLGLVLCLRKLGMKYDIWKLVWIKFHQDRLLLWGYFKSRFIHCSTGLDMLRSLHLVCRLSWHTFHSFCLSSRC